MTFHERAGELSPVLTVYAFAYIVIAGPIVIETGVSMLWFAPAFVLIAVALLLLCYFVTVDALDR